MFKYNSFDVYDMKCNSTQNEPFMSYQRFKKGGRVAKSQFLEKSVQK